MGHEATARIPFRPLSYANASLATNKELIADWDNHKIYMKDSAGAVVEISGSGSSGEETNIINYTTNTLLTCTTAGATAIKTVNCENYALKDGNNIYIKFSNANTAASPTLNINATGAKNIKYRGTNVEADYIKTNKIYHMFYTGGAYEIVGDLAEAAKDYTPEATDTTPGLISAEDKKKLDSITDDKLVSASDRSKLDNITDDKLVSASDRSKLDSISSDKLISVSDRTKIDSIPDGGLVIDKTFNSNSNNPVSGKAVAAELDNYLLKSGGTLTGALVAQANTNYTTYQVRNIALNTSASTPTGNGSILGVYS